MKTIINRSILAIFCMMCSCKEDPEISSETIILIDNTDTINSKPNKNQIINNYNLKEENWQTITITVTFLSNKDLTSTKLVRLKGENRLSTSKQLRQVKVENFKRDLENALIIDSSSTLQNSIIYRKMARHLNDLSKSKASKKQMIVFSDLMENAEVNFYDYKTFSTIQANPNGIIATLQKQEVINNLKGVEVLLIFDPKSYQQNNTYMIVANFYKDILEAKGAKVYIQQSLSQQL